MTKKRNWEAFVLKDTNIPWTEIWNSSDVEVELVKPEEVVFEAAIKYSCIGKGYGSGCKLYVTDTQRNYTNKIGETEPMRYGVFLCDANVIINNMDHGIMTGVFTITKRGQDYGIKLIKMVQKHK